MWQRLFQFLRTHGPQFLLLTLYFTVLSVGLRYPTSINLNLVPLDPNFPLHALAAQDLSDGGSGLVNTRLEWPDGAPIRYLAWPLLLISQLFEGFMRPIPALHVGIVAWLTVQGLTMFYLFRDLLQDRSRAICAATLALCSPQVLIALGNAQFENVAPAFLLLIGWSILRQRYAWLVFGLFGACFSSPYMGFLGLLLALLMGFRDKWVYVIMMLSSGSVWLYYDAVTGNNIHESTQPAPSVMAESANPIGLFLPINIAENGGTDLPSMAQRFNLLQTAPTHAPFDDTWFWVMVTASSFLGIAWVTLGVLGLWQKRQDPIAWNLSLWALTALTCSFGDQFILDLDSFKLSIPWVWSLTDFMPGLSDMNATHRFLMAPSLVLALGVACIGNRLILFIGTILCVFEALFISPAHWPIPSKQATIPKEIAFIQKPFIFWPPPPVISSYKVTMTGLLLDQPIALFSAQQASMPDANGAIPKLERATDRRGRSLEQWTQMVIDQDVNNLIQYRSFHEVNGNLPLRIHQRKCYQSYCLSLLVHEAPEY